MNIVCTSCTCYIPMILTLSFNGSLHIPPSFPQPSPCLALPLPASPCSLCFPSSLLLITTLHLPPCQLHPFSSLLSLPPFHYATSCTTILLTFAYPCLSLPPFPSIPYFSLPLCSSPHPPHPNVTPSSSVFVDAG